MNLSYREFLPADFSQNSRVWVYQASRLVKDTEIKDMKKHLDEFVDQWQSHGTPVKGYANLFFSHFILLMADETASGVSGCSTDSSVRLIKQLEHRHGISFFDREMLAFVINDEIRLMGLSELDQALSNQILRPDSLYFNNMVQNKVELEHSWIISLRDSWLAKRVKLPVAANHS
jgi:hypothetical protein